MYKVQIEVFEGPMELLLHLVEKNQLDIYTVSIAAITDQFIEFVGSSTSIDLDNIGEFMVMASLLMRIKIKQLLPASPKSADDEEDLVAEEEALVERLIEYRMFKEVAAYLEERVEGRVARVYYRSPQDHEMVSSNEWSASLEQLLRAFLSLEKEIQPEQPIWEMLPQSDVDVDKMMTWLLTELAPGCEFHQLWGRFANRRERVALFLGLLELIHRGQVEANQKSPLGTITLSRKEVAVC